MEMRGSETSASLDIPSVCERREKVEYTPDRDRSLGALLGHIERHGLDGNADIHEENSKGTDELHFLLNWVINV
jgi:hypothetical protein